MKRRASICLLAAAVVAQAPGCTKDVDRQPPPAVRVEARFDPTAIDQDCNLAPILAIPTDLARDPKTGLLDIPTDGVGAAQAELNAYLSTLDGYPTSAVAAVQFSGELADESAEPENLAKAITVLAITAAESDEQEVEVVRGNDLSFSYSHDRASGVATVSIRHNSGWQRGQRYVLLVVGKALTDKEGRAVTRSAAFEMVALNNPICEVDADGKCGYNYSALLESLVERSVSACDNADGSKTAEELDKLVEARLLESATALELLRQTHNELLELGKQAEIDPLDVVLAWSFTTASMPEAVFDPTAGKIPGPANDLIIATQDDADNGCTKDHVCLPAAAGESEDDEQLRLALNALDGFTTTGATWGTFTADLDPKSVDASAVRLINTDNPTEQVPVTLRYNAAEKAIVITPAMPLRGGTRYGVALLSQLVAGDRKAAGGLADQQGGRVVPSPIFAMARLSESLVDAEGKSTLNLLDDASAAKLERVRQGLAPLFAALSAASIERQDVVLGWTFRTQTISEPMTRLHALPQQVFGASEPKLSGAVVPNAVATAIDATFPSDAIAFWVPDGTFRSYSAIDPATGTFLAADKLQTGGQEVDVPIVLTIPSGAAPANGWPAVIFLHALASAKEDMLAVANGLAKQKFVTIAFGAPNAALLDLSDPAATRDRLRQVAIDATALLRAITGGATSGLTLPPPPIKPEDVPLKIDPSRVQLFGHSTGGMIGAVLLAVDSVPQRGVLAAAGGPWIVGIAEKSATFAPLLAEEVSRRGYDAGSLEALRLVTTLQWILDPADPVNFARFVTGQQEQRLQDRVTNAEVTRKDVILLKGTGDSTVPAAAQQALADALGVDTSGTTYAQQDHGFILSASPSAPATQAAQSQAATFLATGQLCKPDVVQGTCEL